MGSKQKAFPEYLEWKNSPNEENYNKLLGALEPTINSAMFSFGGNDTRLKVRAHILVDKALKTYDADKGAALNTHVYNHLKRLDRYRAQRQYVVHVPENVRADATAVKRYSNEWMNTKDLEPSIAQISDGLGISQKRIKKALLLGREVSDTGITTEKGDLLLSNPKDGATVWTDYIYHDLDERGKKIMEWATGYNGVQRLPKNEIAKRLKISPAAVSSRINTIVKRIEEYE
jgi:DNA-directed RNA polymerase specialized sigma subunit